jgi:tetratricopeptide (TPR) repeat protein/uncharacterized caspase-like protein
MKIRNIQIKLYNNRKLGYGSTVAQKKLTGKTHFKHFLNSPIVLLFLITYGFIIFCNLQILAQTTKGIVVINENEKPGGDIHAVIIGISDYSTYPDLKYADKDAKAFYNLLLSDAFRADSNKVRLLINEQAKQNDVDKALKDLVGNVKEGDHVFIYFSGHGGVERGLVTSQPGFLLTWEANEKSMRFSAFPIGYLNEIVGELATEKKTEVFLIVDACHSGKVEEGKHLGLSPINEYIGKIIYGTSFLSSKSDELSLEGTQWGGGRGLFSYHLVNGLAGKADMEDDKGKKDDFIDINEIDFYVTNRVKKEALPNKQTPVFTGKENVKESVLSKTDPEFLKLLEHNSPLLVQVSMRDVNSKGYAEIFLSLLTEDQKVLYNNFELALDKNKVNCDSLESVDFSEAKKIYNELSLSGIPSEFEAIIRRKMLASLQDKPQQLLDKIMLKLQPFTNNDLICTMAGNLKYSSELMGKNHYLFEITLAKYYFFKSICFLSEENFENDSTLKFLCLNSVDSAVLYADNLSFLYSYRSAVRSLLQDYQGGITDCSKAIELDPKDDIAFNNRGLAKAGLQDYSGSIEDYSKAIELKPERADYYCNRGSSKSDIQDFLGAIADYSKAIELDPSYAMTWNNRGNTKYAMKDFQGALKDYSKAIVLEPKNAMFWKNRATYKYAMKDYHGAIEDWSKAIELNPKDSKAWNNRGGAKSDLQDYKGAIEDYSKVIEFNPKDATAYYNRAGTKSIMQDHKGAIEDYSKAIEVDPKSAEAFSNRGVAKRLSQDYSGAIADFSSAIQINPKLAQAYLNRGEVKSAMKDYQGAISDFSIAIEIDPKLSMAFYNRGNIKIEQQDYLGAISDFSKAIELKPKYALAWLNKGSVKSLLLDHTGAIMDFSESIKINPQDPTAWYNRGYAKFLNQDFQGAIADYSKAIEINAQYAAAWYNRALAKYEINDLVGSVLDRLKAIELDPTLKNK